MPFYDYECETCGIFMEFRTIEMRDDPVRCDSCDRPASRTITAPNLAVMHPLHRMAAARNERSRHEPRIGLKTSCCGGGACSHKRKAVGKAIGNPDKPAFRGSKKHNRRPWMLGH